MGALLADEVVRPPDLSEPATSRAGGSADLTCRAAAFLLAAVCGTYLAWHWGGLERPALRFALLASSALSLLLLVRGRPPLRVVVVAAGLAGLFAWSALSTTLSASPTQGLPQLPLLAWYAVLVLGAGAAVRGGAGVPLVGGLVASGAVQAAVGLFDRWGAGSASARASGTFYLINAFAGFLAVLLPLALALALASRRAFGAAAAATVVMGAGLLVSGSRGGTLCAGLGCVAVVAAPLARVRVRLRRSAGLLLVVVGLAWLLSSSLVISSPGSAGSVLASRAGTEVEHSSQRVEWWLGAVRIFADSPVWGSGVGTYKFAFQTHQESLWAYSTSAHNAYAQALAETGLVGGLLLVLSVAAVVVPSVRRLFRRGRSARAVGLAAGLLAGAAHLFIDRDLEYPAFAAVFFLVLGAAAAEVVEVRRGRPLRRPHRAVLPVAVVLVGLSTFLLAGELVVDWARARPSTDRPLVLAAQLHPGDATPWWSLSGIRHQRGDLEGARAALERVTQLDGLNRDVWLALGKADEELGDPAGALDAYRTALRVDPVSPGLHLVLADAYARHDSFGDAFRTIDAGLLIRLRPDDRKLPELARLAQFGRALALHLGDLAAAARYQAALEILGSGAQFP